MVEIAFTYTVGEPCACTGRERTTISEITAIKSRRSSAEDKYERMQARRYISDAKLPTPPAGKQTVICESEISVVGRQSMHQKRLLLWPPNVENRHHITLKCEQHPV
jgi:hypothetical protein